MTSGKFLGHLTLLLSYFLHFRKLVRFSVCVYATSQYPHNCHIIIAVLEFKVYFFSSFFGVRGWGFLTKKTCSPNIALHSTRKYLHVYIHGTLAALVHIGGAWGAPFFCYYGNATPAHQPGRGTEVPNCKLSLCVYLFCTRVYVCVCMRVVTLQI